MRRKLFCGLFWGAECRFFDLLGDPVVSHASKPDLKEIAAFPEALVTIFWPLGNSTGQKISSHAFEKAVIAVRSGFKEKVTIFRSLGIFASQEIGFYASEKAGKSER